MHSAAFTTQIVEHLVGGDPTKSFKKIKEGYIVEK